MSDAPDQKQEPNKDQLPITKAAESDATSGLDARPGAVDKVKTNLRGDPCDGGEIAR